MNSITTSREGALTLLAEGQVPFDGISVEKGIIGLWADDRLTTGKSEWTPRQLASVYIDGDEATPSELADLVREALGEGTRYVYRIAPDGRMLAANWL